MAAQPDLIKIAVRREIAVQTEAEVRVTYDRPSQPSIKDSAQCLPTSDTEQSPPQYTRLSPSELMDVACAYVARDELPADVQEFSEGYLRDMLRRTNGMHFDQVRALWFDAIERGNAVIERYRSERLLLEGQCKAKPPSGEHPSGH